MIDPAIIPMIIVFVLIVVPCLIYTDRKNIK